MFWPLKNNRDASVRRLNRIFSKAAIGTLDCAHLCIDVQKSCAARAKSVARNISGNIVPAFRQAGIPNYWIYMQKPEYMDDSDKYDFFEVLPMPGEKTVPKDDISAFRGSDIDALLQERKTKLLTLTGFAFSCCVEQTAKDAIDKGYTVVLLSDGINVARQTDVKQELSDKGVIFTNSQNFFSAFRTL